MRSFLFGIFWVGVLWVSSAMSMEISPVRRLLENEIRQDLRARKGTSFGELLSGWERKYGAEALPVLADLARSRDVEEYDRYVALMGAVRLGGYGTASVFQDLLDDSSWLLRSGALRVLKATGKSDTGITPALRKKILERLKDPALVVRAEAVETVEELRIPGAVSALLEVLQDERNYPGGKALWVPQKALRALSELGGPRCLPGAQEGLVRRVRLGVDPGVCEE